MYDTSFDDAINKKVWMFDVKERVQALYNQHVPSNNFEKFVKGLDSVGLIKLMKCGDCDNYNERPKMCLKGIEVFTKNMVECPHMTNKEIKTFKIYY